jgi:hypothetical protein
MTLIAAFSVSGFPVVFGDLLVTGPTGSEQRTVATPAAGEVQDFFGDSGWGVGGLRQKVNVISENCIVAWSGSWLGARIAIAGLRSLAAESALTSQRVLDYLRNEPELTNHPASFVGLLSEGPQLCQFQFGAETSETESLGLVYMSGSGSKAIPEFCQLMDNNETSVTGTPGNAEKAISYALNLGSLLLQSELRGGDAAATIRNMFGGGYEIAFFSEGRPQKLSDVTYIFWEAELNQDVVTLSLPRLLVKQRYANDHLIIRSARLGVSASDGSPTLTEEQRHIIGPMFETTGLDNPASHAAFSFTSNIYCHCVATRLNGMEMGVYTKVQRYSPQTEIPFLFTENESGFTFSVRNDALLDLTNAIKKLGQPPAPRTDA